MLAISAGSASAEAPFVVDRAHASASFHVSHLTLTTVSGRVAIKEIALVGIGPDTREAARDSDLRSDHWFDVAKSPDMIFKSSKITGDAKAMTIAGDRTFHGVTKPVTLSGGRGRTHVGYRAGMSFPAAIVGNDITVKIDVEAVQTPSSRIRDARKT